MASAESIILYNVMLSGVRSNIKMAEIQNIENPAVYFPSDLRIKYPG